MNCKYCNAELVEGKPFCPSCGKEQLETEETVAAEVAEVVAETAVTAEEVAETQNVEESAAEETATESTEIPAQAENKAETKATPGKIALAVVGGIVVLAILISLIVSGKNRANTNTPVDDPAETVAAVEIPSNGDPASPLCKATYTVSEEDAKAASDVIVATMGDKVLTNGELQAYYWQEIYLFLQEYGSYASYIGLNLSAPLDTQLSQAGESAMSWQQFFLESALYSWQNYQSMALEAEANGYQLSEERQAEIDNMPAELSATALNNGFETVDDMIGFNVGAACTMESYMRYVDVYYNGMSYYYDYVEALDPTDEEIEAFFTENEEYYSQNGITKESKYVDVRHVLLQPEGGETGEDGYPVFTEEAWEDCRVKAEEIYNKWQEGDKSEDSFAQLAKDHSVDGNAATGGLYENVYKGQMVADFENWCFDEARQAGDHGLVKTQFGYHIMFFCASRDAWYINAERDLIDDLAYDYIPEIIEKYPAQIDYSLIVLSNLPLA